MIQIIDIRKHNDYCELGMLHGLDMKQLIIKRPIKIKPLDKKNAGKLDKGINQILKSIQNVKR